MRLAEPIKIGAPSGTGAPISGLVHQSKLIHYRNDLVIAIGFVPMDFASLLPYAVVGVLLASIMLLSWLASLLLLPAFIALFGKEKEMSVEASPG